MDKTESEIETEEREMVFFSNLSSESFFSVSNLLLCLLARRAHAGAR